MATPRRKNTFPVPLIVLAAATIGEPALSQTTFTDVSPPGSYFQTPSDTDFWATAIAPADVDGDGDMDLAVAGHHYDYNGTNDDRVVLLRNDGPGTNGKWQYTATDVLAGNVVQVEASDLAWGDFDNDGDKDLVVATINGTRLLRNNAGTLTLLATVLPAYYESETFLGIYDLRSLSWADYDNDSDLDMLLPSAYDEVTKTFRHALLRNDGADGANGWTFTEVAADFGTTLQAQTTWIDDDGDGDLDLFMSSYDPKLDALRVQRFANTVGTFQGTDLVADGRLVEGSADFSDGDGDGDIDIVVSALELKDQVYTAVLRMYRNVGGGNYDMVSIEPGTIDWWDLNSATWADYDSDGDVDILATGVRFTDNFALYTRAEIYANNGSGAFAPVGLELPAPVPTFTDAGAYTWFDLDGDADLDYVVAGGYYTGAPGGPHEARIVLLRNLTAANNAAPAVPQGVNATAGAGTVSLNWPPPEDDHTPSAALTYDVYLRAAGATATSGARVPEIGQIAGSRSFAWRGLPSGQYRWQVRAVDAAYAGSALQEGTITVPSSAAGLFSDGFE